MLDIVLNSPQQEPSVLDELLNALAAYPGWAPLRKALKEGEEFVNWIGHEHSFDIGRIRFEEGHGCHHVNGGIEDTSYRAYLKSIIEPLISKAEISDGSRPGSHDDRKLRWSDTQFLDIIDSETLTLKLAVGPTWFQHCQVDIHRDRAEATGLMLDGLQRHQDPYAFFARGMGIVVIPLTRDGHAFIGRRAQTSEYSNYLCFVAGWLSFPESLNELDIYSELERELREEINLLTPIATDQIKLIGLAGHPFSGETDLVFVVQTDLTDDHFFQGVWPEHQDWFSIRNSNEAKQLLKQGRVEGINETLKLMFSSRAGLEFLIHKHWAE
jgi:8-oxo-dGTP pyrophosphatase MutT (NUDIX family)